MNFKQFHDKVYSQVLGSALSKQTWCCDRSVVETVEGTVYVDGEPSTHSSLEEAVESIKLQKLQENIQRAIHQELYEEISDNKVADVIRRYHSQVRVTDTLIESYVELASSKLFTTDPVAHELRKFNSLDRVLEGYIDYVLADGSTVVVSESTQQRLNNILSNHQDVVEYMRESKDAFLSVLNLIEE